MKARANKVVCDEGEEDEGALFFSDIAPLDLSLPVDPPLASAKSVESSTQPSVRHRTSPKPEVAEPTHQNFALTPQSPDYVSLVSSYPSAFESPDPSFDTKHLYSPPVREPAVGATAQNFEAVHSVSPKEAAYPTGHGDDYINFLQTIDFSKPPPNIKSMNPGPTATQNRPIKNTEAPNATFQPREMHCPPNYNPVAQPKRTMNSKKDIDTSSSELTEARSLATYAPLNQMHVQNHPLDINDSSNPSLQGKESHRPSSYKTTPSPKYDEPYLQQLSTCEPPELSRYPTVNEVAHALAALSSRPDAYDPQFSTQTHPKNERVDVNVPVAWSNPGSSGYIMSSNFGASERDVDPEQQRKYRPILGRGASERKNNETLPKGSNNRNSAEIPPGEHFIRNELRNHVSAVSSNFPEESKPVVKKKSLIQERMEAARRDTSHKFARKIDVQGAGVIEGSYQGVKFAVEHSQKFDKSDGAHKVSLAERLEAKRQSSTKLSADAPRSLEPVAPLALFPCEDIREKRKRLLQQSSTELSSNTPSSLKPFAPPALFVCQDIREKEKHLLQQAKDKAGNSSSEWETDDSES